MAQPIDYKNTKALSQSSLKVLEYNPRGFYRDEYLWLIGKTLTKPESRPTDPMKLGEIVDINLTRPEDLEKEYVVINNPPTGQMLKFVDAYFRDESLATKSYTENISEDMTRLIASAAYTEALFIRDSLKTVLSRFETEGAAYYTALRNSIGKTVVSAELMGTAMEVTEALKTDEYTGPIVGDPGGNLLQDVYNQLPIYFNLGGVPLKALVDKVIVSHRNKTIQPYDIKTCGDSFWTAFGNYRYDIQGAFYLEAIRVWRDITLNLNDYKLMPFRFIVGYTNGKGYRPELWEMSWQDEAVGRNGGSNRMGRQVKGFLDLLRDYKWHVEHEQWDYPAEVYQKDGVRILNYYNGIGG